MITVVRFNYDRFLDQKAQNSNKNGWFLNENIRILSKIGPILSKMVEFDLFQVPGSLFQDIRDLTHYVVECSGENPF